VQPDRYVLWIYNTRQTLYYRRKFGQPLRVLPSGHTGMTYPGTDRAYGSTCGMSDVPDTEVTELANVRSFFGEGHIHMGSVARNDQ